MTDADTPAPAASKPRRHIRVGVAAMMGGLLIIAAAGWWAWSTRQSTPGTAGQADEVAPAQSAAVAAAPVPRVSREVLRREAERYPRDGRRWALLAYAEFEADGYAEAAAAFEKAVEVSAKIAADPGVLCDWADALGMAQGGTLQGRPAELVSRALALRANYPKALEMAGSAAYENRAFALAADYWRRLLPQLQEGTTARRALEDAIARADRLAATSL